MHVPVQAAPELAADRPGRVRLDAHAPTHTPAHGSSSARPRAPSDVRPADTGAAMRDGGCDTFLRAARQRALDFAAATAAAAPLQPPLLPLLSTPTPTLPPPLPSLPPTTTTPTPTLPPEPSRLRRVSLTVRRVISVQDGVT